MDKNFNAEQNGAVIPSVNENSNLPTSEHTDESIVLTNKKKNDMNTEKKKLVREQIYSLSDLMQNGYKFGKLIGNRAIKANAIKAKIKSIKQNGIISPSLVVSAKECLKQGLMIIDNDGKIINEEHPEIENLLIIVDGGHRDDAIKKINQGKQPGEDGFEENYYYLPLSDKATVSALLREANVVTIPWAGSDYLTNLIINNPEASKNEMLKWVHTMIQTSGDTAAWQWARLTKKVPTKTLLKRATDENKDKAEDAYNKIVDDKNFESGKELYELFRKTFSKEILGCKFMPEWVIETIDSLVDENYTKDSAIVLVKEFVGSLVRDDADKLEEIKKGPERAGEVKALLTEWFESYQYNDKAE